MICLYKIKKMSSKISIVSTCYNEKDNIEECYLQIKNLFDKSQYSYEHIFVDNNSTDGTQEILEKICSKDRNIKAIFNFKNYGPFLSNFNALKYTNGDFVIINYAADMQDPIGVVQELIDEIQKGYDVVYAVKTDTEENFIIKNIRRLFYYLLNFSSKTYYPENVNEFMCVKNEVVNMVIQNNDYFPYLRGYFSRITDNFSKVNFKRKKRAKGTSKNSFFDLYTQGINGLISTIDKPIRMITFASFLAGLLSLLMLVYTILAKRFFPWSAPEGIASISVILLFFFCIIISLLSLILEYLIAIHNQVRFNNKVIVNKKINFD